MWGWGWKEWVLRHVETLAFMATAIDRVSGGAVEVDGWMYE